MLTFTPPVVLALGIAVIVCAVFGIMVERARRAGVKEIARLKGKVKGFTVWDIKKDPATLVDHLRSDANICDFAKQKDMADRLRGYAALVERWLDDDDRRNALRRIANGG